MGKKIVGYKPTPGGGRVPIYEDSATSSGSSPFVTDSTTKAPDTPSGSGAFKPIITSKPAPKIPDLYAGVGQTHHRGPQLIGRAEASGLELIGPNGELPRSDGRADFMPGRAADPNEWNPEWGSMDDYLNPDGSIKGQTVKPGEGSIFALGGSGPPGGSASFTTDNTPNTQYKVDAPPGGPQVMYNKPPPENQQYEQGAPSGGTPEIPDIYSKGEDKSTKVGMGWEEPEAPELLETAESEEYEKFDGIKGYDSELFQGLSEADKAQALGIYNARGQEAFAEFLADKAVKGEGSNISYSADSLELIDNAKKAFASGGFGDFFLVADEIDVLGDPKASEEEKAQARARVTEILNNPTENAAPRTASDVKTGNDQLDTALNFIESTASSELTDEQIENLDVDDDTKEAVIEVNRRKKKARLDAGDAFQEKMLAAMRGEGIVDDAGYGTSGGLPTHPPNFDNIQTVRWYLNQALARARHGQYQRGWAQTIGGHGELAGMGDSASQSAWADNRIKKAYDSYQEKHNAEMDKAGAESSASTSPLFKEFIDGKKEKNNKELRGIELEQKKLSNTKLLIDNVLAGGDISDSDLEGIDPTVVDRIKRIRDKTRGTEVRRRAEEIGLNVGTWTEDEQARIEADNEGRLKRFQVETKRIQDENARIMEQYEQDRDRSKSAFDQRKTDFQESERQRLAGNQERDRIVDTAPALATDVALPYEQIDPETGELAPTEAAVRQGIPDRVSSAESKILAGGTLTEADIRGLPADQRDRLINLSTTTTNQMMAGDLSRANEEVQIEARRRLLDPFTQGSGANVYGMGNANQTFGRNVMSGLEQRIAGELDNVRVNADVERASQKRGINTQFDQAIERLARVFATSPDKLSGAAQRRFEELESGRATALNQVDVTVDGQVREETRRNIELMTGLQESREGAAYKGQELGIQALREATGFAGQLSAQDLQAQGIEEQRQSRMSSEALEREMAYGGDVPISMSGMGISPEISRGEQFNQLADRLPGILGRAPTQEEVDSLLDGGSLEGRTTVSAEVQRRDIAVREDQQKINAEIQRGDLSLSETIQKGNLAIAERGMNLDEATTYGAAPDVSMFSLTGVEGALLSESGGLAEGATIDAVFAAQTQIENSFLEQIGRKPSAGEMTSLLRGASVGGKTTLAAREAQNDRTHALSLQANDNELAREQLYGGYTSEYDRKVAKASTLAKSDQNARNSIAKKAQALDEKIQTGQLDNATMAIYSDVLGSVRDPETGQKVTTLAGKANLMQDKEFKDSVRRFNAQFLGELTDENGNIKEGIDSKAASAQIASTLSQINRSDRESNANIGVAWATLTGQSGMPGPITANDLGMDITALSEMSPVSWPSTEEWDMAKDAISDMTGTAPTDDQIRSVLSGDQIMVDGAPTLEAKSISAKVMQANMDRAVQVNQLEKEFGLKQGQLSQATEAADRQWSLATQDVASIFDIPQDDWANARSKYERALSNGLTPQEAAREASERSGLNPSDFMQANNLFEERFGAAARQAAIDSGLSAEQWEATKDAREEMDKRETQYWDGIMNNVGQSVSLSNLVNKLPLPEMGAETLERLGNMVDGIIEPYTRDGSRMSGRAVDGPELASARAGILDMFRRDPQGAKAKMIEIQEASKSGGTARLVQKLGVPEPVVKLLIDSGGWSGGGLTGGTRTLGDSTLAITRAFGFLETSEYTGINMDEAKLTDAASIQGMLQDAYDITPEDAEKYAAGMLKGENFKIPPKDWIATMDPFLRQEVLSLIHGGTSFGIAQKEPSMAQSLGGFAGAGLSAFIGAGAPGLGGAATGLGGKLFDGLFGGGGGGGNGARGLSNTGAF